MDHSDLIAALEKLVRQYSIRRPSPDVAITIRDFCRLEGISHSTFHKWQRAGFGPEVSRIPGMTLQRITPQAYRGFKKKRAAAQRTQAATIAEERAQRVARTRVAGQLAAQSPLHVSKRGKRRKPKS